MKITNIFLLIFLKIAIHSVFGQNKCDTTQYGENEEIFVIVEIMPTPNITSKQLEIILNSSIDLNEYPDDLKKPIYITFIINCKGEDFNYKFHTQIDQKLQVKLNNILKSNLNWTPAYHNGEPVDISKNIKIEIVNNQFQVPDFENQKRNKKSRKKK
ncbi:MAG: hypothetical protein KJ578_04140 [Bacteroidetes bacterium]|nr:hypothetical protein [Bacteroidota bacterium]MBU1578105.1 hypothetical protein [Bacteroidota bacterium]MBU2556952.1 hypothetical protein [Bacteroidota bacterium]